MSRILSTSTLAFALSSFAPSTQPLAVNVIHIEQRQPEIVESLYKKCLPRLEALDEIHVDENSKRVIFLRIRRHFIETGQAFETMPRDCEAMAAMIVSIWRNTVSPNEVLQ